MELREIELIAQVGMSHFSEHQIRRALVGFCGANENALLHFLTYTAAVENQAAIDSGEAPETSTNEYLVDFQAAIMAWLDAETKQVTCP